MRQLTYAQAIREATDLCMEDNPRVYVIGEGVPDPKGIFGTTLGLQSKYGPERVMDMPLSEAAMTGVIIGSALTGWRPILTHQRSDFAVISMNQIVNDAAKWHYMFGGQATVPIVIRMVVGRGWGQGAQHAQSLQAWFAHVPGLKVVMPVTPHDAKGLLIASVEDNNPVVFIEHRWLHQIHGDVPEGMYRVPLGEARIARPGRDLTIAAMSYMTLEALRAAERLSSAGVEAEVIDIRTLKPLDIDLIVDSVRRTGRLIAADTSWRTASMSSEVVARVVEEAFTALKAPPRIVALPDSPSPSSPGLARYYYPRAIDIVRAAGGMLHLSEEIVDEPEDLEPTLLDVPDRSFTGPF